MIGGTGWRGFLFGSFAVSAVIISGCVARQAPGPTPEQLAVEAAISKAEDAAATAQEAARKAQDAAARAEGAARASSSISGEPQASFAPTYPSSGGYVAPAPRAYAPPPAPIAPPPAPTYGSASSSSYSGGSTTRSGTVVVPAMGNDLAVSPLPRGGRRRGGGGD
jgi:hypothetical protein